MARLTVTEAEALEARLGANRPDETLVTEDEVIKTATEEGASWGLLTEGGIGFSISRNDFGWDAWDEFRPEPGDSLTMYSDGGRVVGIDLNGERVFLKTEREVNLEWLLYRAKHARKQGERFERERESLNADYEALPQVFKDRIDRFRHNNPRFREEFEGYEMFCCTEGVKLAEAAHRGVEEGLYADEVDAFWADGEKVKLAGGGWEEPDDPYLRWLYWAWALHSKAYDHARQKEVIGLADGHSGNTAGAALMLARLYIESPEYVARLHGALSPLVGSADYGDINPDTGEVG